MDQILLILSSIGILNSFILIIYSLTTKKGPKIINFLLAFLILALTMRVWKSVLLSFASNLHDFILNLGLAGFLLIGPLFYLLTKYIFSGETKFQKKDIIHILPGVLLIGFWWGIAFLRDNEWLWWSFVYRLILFHYLAYLLQSVKIIEKFSDEMKHIKFQLNIIAIFLLVIWMTYLFNHIAHSPYLGGAIVYSGLIYFSLVIFINRGYLIDFLPNKKYQKTGVDSVLKENITSKIIKLFEEEMVFTDNSFSLPKLAALLNTSTHIVSQVINENFNKSFFELLSNYRVNEACKILTNDNSNSNISEIAFSLGYNSLSSFNKSFKNITGKTPTQYRNGLNNNGE